MEAYFKTGFSILPMNFCVDYDESLRNYFQQRGAEMSGGGGKKKKNFFSQV